LKKLSKIYLLTFTTS